MHLNVTIYELFCNFVAQNRKIDDYDKNIKKFFVLDGALLRQ